MRKAITIILLLLQVSIANLFSQSTYPVTVTPVLTPPYSLSLSDYCSLGSQQLMINITVNDLNISNMPVKLRITFETVGVTIQNPVTFNTTPIYLDGGSTTILFGKDLADNFNIDNLEFKGYSKEAYNRTGQLPEGYYKITVELLHYQNNRTVSNQGTTTAWISIGKPPELKLPADDTQVGQYDGMPITFTWLESNVGSPVSAGSIQYLFEMWEMRIDGIAPATVAASTPVFYEYSTYNTAYSLYPSSLLMEPGMKYAWRVTASDITGLIPFEQDGESDIWTFEYKADCDTISDFQAKQQGQSAIFSWEAEENHSSFNVEIRNPSTEWTSNSETFDNQASFFDLDYGSTYEMRVQAVCDGDDESTSDFSEWKSITIKELESLVDTNTCPDCGCDDQIPDIELSNFELRDDLEAGDTIINKTGTTRFILESVEQQSDNTYQGVFLFWAEIWNLQIYCNYWDLQVNTDDVIVNMDFESIYNPQFVLDVDAATEYINNLVDAANTLTTSTEIKDTIVVSQTITSIYVNADGEIVAVTVDDDGNLDEEVIQSDADDLSRVLIQGENGEEYVVTSDGDIMGVDEYKATGGKDSNIESYNEENETNNLSETTEIAFSASENQSYGFDEYNEEKSALIQSYPTLGNGYRPAFKSIASYSTDIVVPSGFGDNITFKDEMGIPAIVTGENLSVRGGSDGADVALYAYQTVNDSSEKIAGKLNIRSYDEETEVLYIVPVNNAKIPDPGELETLLNKVYQQAVKKWTVTSTGNINVSFDDGVMNHGGSSLTSVYNSDQKIIVDTFEAQNGSLENDAYYLFFAEDVDDKGENIAGYMPLQRQVGFIYDYPNLQTVAHELAHGAFNLYHTFSDEEYIAAEGTTQNLMDYTGSTELWQHQWDLVQDPDKILFAWAQDEEDAEMSNFNPEDYIVKINDSYTINGNNEDTQDEIIYFVDEANIKIDLYKKKNDELKLVKSDWWVPDETNSLSFIDNKNEYAQLLNSDYTNYQFRICIKEKFDNGSKVGYYKEFHIYFKSADIQLYVNNGTELDPIDFQIDNNAKIYGENSIQIQPRFITSNSTSSITPTDSKDQFQEISIESPNQIFTSDLQNWTKADLIENGITKFTVKPFLGKSKVFEVKTVDAPVVSLTRLPNDKDGSYGLDCYETLKNYNTKYYADYQNCKISIDGNDYYMPDIVITNSTTNINPILFPLNTSSIDGSCKYYITTPTRTITLALTKSNYTSAKPPYYAELNLTKADVDYSTPLEIKDGIGNIKGKIKFTNNEMTGSNIKKVYLCKVIYNGNSASINYNKIKNSVTNMFFNQTNIYWDIQTSIIQIPIDPSKITNITANGKTYTSTYINQLLSATNLSSETQIDDYKIILSYLYSNIFKPKLTSYNGYHIFMLHNEMGSTNGFAISGTKCCYISANWDEKTISHELGHNLGLAHIAVDLGECTRASSNSSSTCPVQAETTNIMGYSNNGADFFIFQKKKINNK